MFMSTNGFRATSAILFLGFSIFAEADQVINDDLIVSDSQCIGFDCIDGESFGFDTLRLKENNLRIRFLDTSNSAQFPTQDWEIQANEAKNGGENQFAIAAIHPFSSTPFKINAQARTNSLVVSGSDFIGFGTGAPAQHLHVVHGNAPTLRLEQDGTEGFTPIVWDLSSDEDTLSISADGSEIFTLETNGDLTISGSLTAGNPQMTFPDYVFAPNYDLMSLEKVGEYIAVNRHLPGIPTAEEAATEGVNMTELQIKLLEKVEELTLYTLQQQRLIEDLQGQIRSLHADVDSTDTPR